jgi:glycosyltransferase involved in cell wall biosynthesis
MFRNSPRWLDRLWDSNPILALASKRSISTSPKMLGEMTVSMLKGEDGFQRKEIEKLTEWARHETPPDVVSLPYSLLISLAKPIKAALGRPICCTLQGEDLFLDGLQEPYRSQSLELIKENVKHVDAFISVSEFYAGFVPDYLGIAPEKIHVVPLGINLQGYEMRRRDSSQPFTIGFFARIAPEKGLHVLAQAYKELRTKGLIPEARLEAAGYMAPEHAGYLSEIEMDLKATGLGGEFRYHGTVDREQKINFLRSLDVLSVPATYDEPKGIFLLEAMACGVPVVQPRRGGFTEVVEKTGGGLLVEPDSVEALVEGIARIFREPELGEALGKSGFDKVREHYNVSLMADRALEVYEEVISRG